MRFISINPKISIEEIKLISTYNTMNTAEKWHGTTIVLLRKNNETVVAGDGQVSLGNTAVSYTHLRAHET